MPTYDLIIRNGLIVDGTGTPPFAADLGVSDGHIAYMGDLSGARATKVIDAGGRYVGPGFVDIHTHYDVQVFRDPTLSDALQNGTTLVAMGNCGISLAPCRESDRERYMLMLEATEQIPLAVQTESIPWTWETLPQFLDALRATRKSVNLLMYAPIATIQTYVMGVDESKRRPATDAELQQMKALVSEAMDAGAAGLSMCFLGDANPHVDSDGSPLPTDLMPEDQIVAVASVLKERGDGVIQCLSGRAGFDRTVRLSERLARDVGRPVIHNFLPSGREGGRKALEWHDRMNGEGRQVFTQAFNGRGWSEISLTTAVVHDLNPTWRQLAHGGDGDVHAALAKLKDPAFRAAMRASYDPVIFEQHSGALEQMTFVQAGKAEAYNTYLGLTLSQIAERRQANIVDVYADINLASEGEAVFKCIPKTLDINDVLEQMKHERIIISGSDGGAHIKAIANGGWPTDMLTWLVRETQAITIERAHYLMSYVPARAMGVRDRGAIIAGMAADLVIYHLHELYFDMQRMYHSHDLPRGDWRKRVRAGGYHSVIVNGRVVYDHDQYTGEDCGELISPSPLARSRHPAGTRRKTRGSPREGARAS